MNDPRLEDEGVQEQPQEPGAGHVRSHWLMMLCCVPMVIVAVALVISGASLAPLVIALACAGLMAAMMLALMKG